MVYVTGDCHGDFRRFSKKGQKNSGIKIADDDYIIVCGDFALLWAKNRELEYNLRWFSQLPYTVLWVQGNHENYNMIEGYPLEEWHGGNALVNKNWTRIFDFFTALTSFQTVNI